MPLAYWIKTSTPGLYKHKFEPDKWLVCVQINREKRYSERENRVIQGKTTINRVVYGEAEAYRVLGEAKMQRARGGQPGDRFSYDFREAWAQYEKLGRPAQWDEQDVIRNKGYVSRLHAYFDGRDVREIDAISILEFFSFCRQEHKAFRRPLGDASIKQLKSLMAQFWDFLVSARRYELVENPVRKAKPEYSSDKGEISVALTATQLKELLQHTQEAEPLSALCMVGLASLAGLRRGEICGLRWQDVEFDQKRLNLTHQRRQNAGHIDFVNYLKRGKKNGKTRAELRHRYAALPDTLAKILHMVHDDQERILGHDPGPAGWVYNPAGCLMGGTTTNPKTLDAVMERVVRHTRKAQIAQKSKNVLPVRVRLHDLRHTHVSLCLNGKVPITQVYASTGHKFTQAEFGTGLAVYWHDDENRSEIIECIDSVVK